MPIDIELLSRQNTSLLNRVAPDVFDNAIELSFVTAFVNEPRHIMYIALDDGVVVGMASAVEYFHPDKPPQLWINEVGVAASHRRQGIGRKLTQALISAAEDRGCLYAWLGTAQDNVAGQACFGSVPNGETPQPFLLYEWDLE